MGILNVFNKKEVAPLPLPKGTFTVDRAGQLLSSTIPSAFPRDMVERIAQSVLVTFQQAQQAQLVLTEINLRFSSFKIKARELRGGAIIFVSPRELGKE